MGNRDGYWIDDLGAGRYSATPKSSTPSGNPFIGILVAILGAIALIDLLANSGLTAVTWWSLAISAASCTMLLIPWSGTVRRWMSRTAGAGAVILLIGGSIYLDNQPSGSVGAGVWLLAFAVFGLAAFAISNAVSRD